MTRMREAAYDDVDEPEAEQGPGQEPVSRFMAEDVEVVAGNAPLTEVADRLVAASVGALVVVDERGRPVAVVSERDVVRAVADDADLAAARALDVATRALVWCDIDATVAEVAAEMMDRYVRHALVEDEGRFVGIVSARDLLGAFL